MGILLFLSPFGRLTDFIIYDTLLVSKPSENLPDNIVIVAIDETSFEVLGRQWPWPRGFHAKLIDALFEAGAAAVALDILFPEPSWPDEDHLFAQALNEKVVLAASFEIIQKSGNVLYDRILPLPLFLDQKCRVGLDILPLDPDGLLRKSIPAMDRLNGLAVEAVMAYCASGFTVTLLNNSRNFNDMLINFSGPPGNIVTVSYYQVLESEKYLPVDIFKNKLVFVGFSIRNAVLPNTALADHYPTPYVRFGSGHMSGVEIQANIAANLLNGNFIKKTPVMILVLPAVFFWVMTRLVSYRLSPVTAGCIGLGVFVVGSAMVYFSFVRFRLFIPVSIIVYPGILIYLSALFVNYYRQLKEKTYIKEVFSRYVSGSVVKELLKHPEQLAIGGKFAKGTVIFLDIKNFTRLTRQTPARELICILSRYLGRFSDIVLENHGMVDKIAGDALMAVWGVPLAQKDHAVLACRAVLEIDRAWEALRKEDDRLHKTPLSIRIGINSGIFLAGNIGGKYFSDYTVHGVDVNFAHQLESLNKKYNTRILMGPNTKALLTDEFDVRALDVIDIGEDASPIAIYELRRDLTGG